MKKVVMKRLTLQNFKNFRQQTFDFGADETTVSGRNASGKTTMFDAFCWLWTGADSQGRTTFDIKTRGADGEPMHKAEHSVEGVFDIDGTELTLRRIYKEKWGRVPGSEEEVLMSHETTYEINSRKVRTKTKFEQVIGEIVPKQWFRLLTCEGAFFEQSDDAQKNILYQFAQGVDDAAVASSDERFAALIEALGDKSMEVEHKEILDTKRKVKGELEKIPGRIATAQDVCPEDKDWVAIADERDRLVAEREQVRKAMMDKSEAYRLRQQVFMDRQAEISKIEADLMEFRNKAKLMARESRRTALDAVAEAKGKLANVQHQIKDAEWKIGIDEGYIKDTKERMDKLMADYEAKEAEQFTYDDKALVCPTCHRPYDAADADAMIDTWRGNWQSAKANALEKIMQEGKSLNQTLESKEQAVAKQRELLDALKADEANIEAEIKRLEASVPAEQQVVETEAEKNLVAKIAAAKAQLEADKANAGTNADDGNTDRLNELDASISQLDRDLSQRDTFNRCWEEIQRLQGQQTEYNKQLAELERKETDITDFIKTKDRMALDAINSHFRIARFSFTDQRLNGNEKIACNCTDIHGVPYGSVNAAMRVNMGIDVINAISELAGVRMPLFVDNAESVNQVLDSEAQRILMSVTTDDLKVQY
ncbi:MAG: ATP-binding protein [Bacteroidales bacterium]|nr:ATP-binding protein [Bacteroidales bacterium]